jgi:hypothetical protein
MELENYASDRIPLLTITLLNLQFMEMYLYTFTAIISLLWVYRLGAYFFGQDNEEKLRYNRAKR